MLIRETLREDSFSRKKTIIYGLPPLIVFLLLLLVYSVNNIWPLGIESISYFDMPQAYVPKYFHIYDAMHFDSSLLYDWYTGTGVGLAGNISSFISPFNLILYLVPREFILNAMSLLLLVKMSFMAFTAAVFLNNVYKKLDIFFKILLSVMYAFSGYILMFYTNISWLDTAMLFPILLLTFLNLLHKQKPLPFIIAYAATLLSGFYIAYMVTLFLLFTSALYVIFILPKYKKGKSVFLLGISVVTSFLISAGAIIPEYIQMSASSRANGNLNYFKIISKDFTFDGYTFTTKLLMLLGTELFIALIIKLIFARRVKIKEKLFFSLQIFYLLIPIVFERVNLIWHTGSYAMFPYRFGFILSFVLIWTAAFYLEKYESLNYVSSFVYKKKDKKERKEKNKERKIIYTAQPSEYEEAENSFIEIENKLPQLDYNLSETENLSDDLLLSEEFRLTAETENDYFAEQSNPEPDFEEEALLFEQEKAEEEPEVKPLEEIVNEEPDYSIPELILMILKKVFKSRVFYAVLGVIAAILFVSVMPGLNKLYEAFNKEGVYFYPSGIKVILQEFSYILIALSTAFLLITTLKSKKIRNTVIALFVLVPLIFYSIGFIGISDSESKNKAFRDNRFISNVLNVKADLDAENVDYGKFDRIKNIDGYLNSNYPMILQRSAISNWTHMIPRYLQTGLNNLGYTTVFTRTVDTGGTAFSDALLGVKNVLSKNEISDDALYKFNMNAGDFKYYDCNYTLPFGITADSEILSELPTGSKVDANNQLYRSITGTNDSIMTALKSSNSMNEAGIISKVQSGNSITYTIKITDSSELYFASTHSGVTLRINGTLLKIGNVDNDANTTYPITFNNNLLALGSYKDQVINVTVSTSKEPINSSKIFFSTLSLDKLAALTDIYEDYSVNVKTGGSDFSFTVNNGQSGKYAFIPVGYDKGWSCKINGESVQIQQAATCFMAVALKDGVNNIEFSYVPQGLIPGLLISFTSLATVVIFSVVVKRRKKPIRINKYIGIASKVLLYVIAIGGTAVVYVLPIIYSLIKNFG